MPAKVYACKACGSTSVVESRGYCSPCFSRRLSDQRRARRIRRGLTVHEIPVVVGAVYGWLTVLAEADAARNTLGQIASRRWLCSCSCGSEPRVVRQYQLISGRTRSCGCLHDQVAGERLRRLQQLKGCDGRSYHPLWKTWTSMISRCHNPHDQSYRNYGGRGIHVCSAWRESFYAFVQYMEPLPKPEGDLVGQRPMRRADISIGRIDNDKGYVPGNVEWQTRRTQARNRRDTVYVTLHGVTRPLISWCEEFGLSSRVVRDRICKLHWPIDRALGLPRSEDENG